jgi:hypothetical protein
MDDGFGASKNLSVSLVSLAPYRVVGNRQGVTSTWGVRIEHA